MEEYGWKSNQRVDLTTSTGTMKRLKLKPFDIRRGNLMVYYPEANVLISRQIDPYSKTPGFKSVPVTISAVL
jgi:anaerobic selenocysteine-containing dehydrogenase